MRDLPNTRQSLILQLKANSGEAWSEFVSIYEAAIVCFCRSRGLQEADAKDVTQEVLAALHRKIENWNAAAEHGSFRAWLFRVARNLAVDRIRARAKGPVAGDDQVLADAATATDRHMSAFLFEYRRAMFSWAAEQVQQEVQPLTWSCFWQTAVEEGDPRDVASRLNVSVGTVYTAKCRVVARLREKFGDLTTFENPVDLDEALLAQQKQEAPKDSSSQDRSESTHG